MALTLMAREPSDLRRDKAGVEIAVYSDDAGTPELHRRERLERVDTNEGGETRKVYRTQDVLDRYLASGRIKPSGYEAGRKFEALFHAAGNARSDAPQWDRLPGQPHVGPEPEKVIAARDALHGAMTALGGHHAPAGHTVWFVVGHGYSLRQYVMLRHCWTNRWQDASGALCAGLPVLASHWGM